MPQETEPRLAAPVAALKHFVSPTSRELRDQAVHRLQVGLFGLAAMLLMVGLANIVMDRARLSEAANPSLGAEIGSPAPQQAGSDPLADIGVAPAADPSSGATPAAKR